MRKLGKGKTERERPNSFIYSITLLGSMNTSLSVGDNKEPLIQRYFQMKFRCECVFDRNTPKIHIEIKRRVHKCIKSEAHSLICIRIGQRIDTRASTVYRNIWNVPKNHGRHTKIGENTENK